MNEENRKLLEALDTAILGERGAVARLLATCILSEEQGQHEVEGFASLVELLTKKHGLDPEEASCRVAAAHIAMKHAAVRDVLVNDRLVAADWKKPLGQLTPGKAVARAFVELCIEAPRLGIDDDDETEAKPSPALSIVRDGAPNAPPGSARRLRT